jgi:glycosyltransferase involved in cell wall biosynthesis
LRPKAIFLLAKIIIIGPAHPLRGGLATFNERMAGAFLEQGHEVILYTFSLQYPSILFPGKSQLSDRKAPDNLKINVCINSINPINWFRVSHQISKEKADIIIVRYWIPFMAMCLGSILRMIKKTDNLRIVALVDNALPHEKRPGDEVLTRYFTGAADGFVTMSPKVAADLKTFTNRPLIVLKHPLYDNFGSRVEKNKARKNLGIDSNNYVCLFFGFIRHYKGLDLLIKAFEQFSAMSKNKIQTPVLLIAGEFYAEEKEIRSIIRNSPASASIMLHSHFIKDEEVSMYFCAADCVVQPYRSATQSGVTPLAYHFEVPMIVTNVGALPDMVPKNIGIVCEPDTESVAEALEEMQTFDLQTFKHHIVLEKQKYSWPVFVNSIIEHADSLKTNG